VWEARTLNNRADLEVALGAISRAERDVLAAQALFREAGQELEEVHTLHNRGRIAFRRGDMPATFGLLHEAALRYEALGVEQPELAIDRCLAYLSAGLTGEASDVVRTALSDHPGQPTQRAELLLMAAHAALADGDPAEALSHARAAGEEFRRQQRPWWELQADLASVRARHALGTCLSTRRSRWGNGSRRRGRRTHRWPSSSPRGWRRHREPVPAATCSRSPRAAGTVARP
jgi:hypothetical protein